MKKPIADMRTLDLFGDFSQPLPTAPKKLSASYLGGGDTLQTRYSWWIDPLRDQLRRDEVWVEVFNHIRAALRMSAEMPPARSDSEDSRHLRVGGAALGIYGENAVTSGSCGK